MFLYHLDQHTCSFIYTNVTSKFPDFVELATAAEFDKATESLSILKHTEGVFFEGIFKLLADGGLEWMETPALAVSDVRMFYAKSNELAIELITQTANKEITAFESNAKKQKGIKKTGQYKSSDACCS